MSAKGTALEFAKKITVFYEKRKISNENLYFESFTFFKITPKYYNEKQTKQY